VISSRSRKRLRKFGPAILLACLIGVGIWFLVAAWLKPPPKPAPPPIPVTAAPVQTGDVPVYLNGIGNVQAYNTVTVRFLVNGTLQKVDFTEGQDVKAGDLLGEIDPRPYQAALDQVIAAKARDEASLANARVDLLRYQKLAAESSVATQVRDTQAALVRQDEATVQNDQAQIEAAALQLLYTKITSPIAGRTGVRQIDAGNIVGTTNTTGLVVVTQLEPISVLFTLPEDDFSLVNKWMAQGPLTVVATSRADNKKLSQGTLLLINNQIDQTTGTIQLKATFDNKDHALWPGQFIDAQLLVETRHNAITVPTAAVQLGPQGTYAYVVKPDNTIEMRPIKVSSFDAGAPQSLIQSGLSAGENVVIDGQVKLRAGMTVKPTVVAPTPPAPPPMSGSAPAAVPPPATPPPPAPAAAPPPAPK
jgi:multidrug efflux system membrane fusion protein